MIRWYKNRRDNQPGVLNGRAAQNQGRGGQERRNRQIAQQM